MKKCSWPIFVATVGFSLALQNASASDSQPVDELLAQVVKVNIERLQSFKTVGFTATNGISFAEEFLKFNPDAKSSTQVEHVKFLTNGNDYYFNITNNDRADTRHPGYEIVGSPDSLQVLDRKAGPILIVNKGGCRIPHDAFANTNLLLSLYSFLSEAKSMNEFPVLTLNEAKNPNTWKHAFENSKFDIETSPDGTAKFLKVSRSLADGGNEVIVFQATAPFLPIDYLRSDNKNLPIREIHLLDTAQTQLGAVPSHVQTKLYLKDGWLMTIMDLNLIKFDDAPEVSEDKFAIDPMNAARIWDADNKVMMEVPK